MKVDPLGQPSQTRWRVLGRGEINGKPIAWLALSPLTGRTHQLRVHGAALGWSIVGDPIYGSGRPGADPALQLHAREVIVPIQKNKEPVRVTAPAPNHMFQRLKACGWTELAPVWRLPRPGDYAACLSSSADSFLSTFRLASNVIGLT